MRRAARQPARVSPGRVPDFFIIGAPKMGTTSLHAMLRRDPQIFMPELKEPLYPATHLPSPPRQKSVASAGPKTLDSYLALSDNATPETRGRGDSDISLVGGPPLNNIAGDAARRAPDRDPA